jgi:uncharacterized membrane protein
VPASQGGRGTTLAQRIDRLVEGLLRHWLLMINAAFGIFVGLPWLAPVLMWRGQEGLGRLIYALYSLFCHQLPERSWFLFGRSFTYMPAEIERVTGAGGDFFALRRFIGDPAMGWKLAWSDRMVSFYGGWLLFGLVYGIVRRCRPAWRGLRWQTAVLMLTPMTVDGITHLISDMWGVGQGFRDSNAWLAALIGHLAPVAFYNGDAWGSFNSLARLITGLLAAAGFMLWLLPSLDRLLRASVKRSQFSA